MARVSAITVNGSSDRASDLARWLHRHALLCILVAALISRLAVVALFARTPITIVDEEHYVALATSLVAGHGFGWGPDEPTSIRPPLYPAFVASIWWLSGSNSLNAVRLVQVLLGLVAVWLTYDIGRRLFDRRVALGAAATVALYPAFLYSTGLLLTECLFIVWLLGAVRAAIALVERPAAGMALMTGALFGAAALTRSIMWPFGLLLGPGVLLAFPALPWARRIALAGSVALGFLAVIGPWSVRNSQLQGTLTVVDTMGGLNLMMGNYAYTPEDRMWDGVSLTGDQAWYANRPATDDAGRPWTEGTKEKWAQRQAFSYILDHPAQTLRRSLLKLADLWGLEREFIAGVQRGAYDVDARVTMAVTMAWNAVYALLAGLFVCCVWFVRPTEWRLHVFLIGLVLFVCAVHSVVFGHSRYHLPLVPIMALYAWAGLFGGFRNWAWRSWRGVGAATLLTGLVLIWSRELLVRDASRLKDFIDHMGWP